MIVQKHLLCSYAAHRFTLGCHCYGCLLFCPSAHTFHVHHSKSVLTLTFLPSSPTMRLGSRVVSTRKPRSRLKRMRTVKSWTSRTSMSADCGTRRRPTWDWRGRLVLWRRRSVCSGYRHCLCFCFLSSFQLKGSSTETEYETAFLHILYVHEWESSMGIGKPCSLFRASQYQNSLGVLLISSE